MNPRPLPAGERTRIQCSKKCAAVDLGVVIVTPTAGKLLASFVHTSRGGSSRWATTRKGMKVVVGRWLREVTRPGEAASVEVEWRES